MAKRGRRTLLTPKMIEDIVDLVRNGVSPVNAAKSIGIGRTTLFEWREQGRGQAKGIYRELEDELQKTEARPVVKAESVVFKLMSSPNEAVALKSAIFVLQSKDKDTYGVQKTLNLGNVDGQTLQVAQHTFDLSKMTDRQLAAYEKYLETLAEPPHDKHEPADQTDDESDSSDE